MSLFRFCIPVFVIGLAGCTTVSHEPPPVPASAVWLSNDELRETLVGNQFAGVTKAGATYSLKFLANGTEVFTQASQAPLTEKWTLKEGLVCIEMKDSRSQCSHVKVTNFEYWFIDPSSGNVNAHLTLVR